MGAQTLTDLVSEPPPLSLPVPVDRLYRMAPEVYQRMVERGLLTGGDGIECRDGLLMNPPTAGTPANPFDGLYRIPLDVYHQIADAGLLGPSDKVELLDGLLVKIMTKGQSHFVVVYLLVDALEKVIADGWFVLKEDPVALPAGPLRHASEPEPDVTVVRGAIRDYLKRKPEPADTALVVEVAESSLREDRAKLTRYAQAGIPVAWLVNLHDRTIEVHTRPAGASAPSGYDEVLVYGEGDEVPVIIDGREVGRIAAREVLP